MTSSIQQRHAPSTERAYNWRDDAACLASDPELFFPTGTTGPAVEQIKKARKICRECPVIMECLRDALSRSDQYGIAGGLTENERRAHRRVMAKRQLSKAALLRFIDTKLK